MTFFHTSYFFKKQRIRIRYENVVLWKNLFTTLVRVDVGPVFYMNFFQIRGHLFSSAGLDVTDVSFILSRSGPSANGTYILRGKKLMLGMKHAFTHTS